MLSVLDGSGDDARVAGFELLWLCIHVLVRRHELSLIVTASITDHDLRRILIWHDNRGLWQSTSESIWVVWLQWLLDHARVQVVPHFELVLG